MSRAPFTAVQQWQLLTPRLYDGTEPSEPRAVVLASVAIDGHIVWVSSTHLPYRDPAMRTEATARLVQVLERLDQPWVLCGDFNQPASAWVPPSARAAPDPMIATYPAEAIDYCVFDGLTAEAEVLVSTASDHLPIVVTTNLET